MTSKSANWKGGVKFSDVSIPNQARWLYLSKLDNLSSGFMHQIKRNLHPPKPSSIVKINYDLTPPPIKKEEKRMLSNRQIIALIGFVLLALAIMGPIIWNLIK